MPCFDICERLVTTVNEFEGRLKLISAAFVLVIVVLIARIGYLQVYDGEKYSRLAEGNRIRIIPKIAPRGNIYDRNGAPLVNNRPGFVVSLLPLTEKIPNEVIDRLANLLNIPKKEIQAKIDAHEDFAPIRIKADIGPEIMTIIQEQRNSYPGVIIEAQPIRQYIYKEQGAHIYGYVSEISDAELEKKKKDGYRMGDMIGKFGLEQYYDQEIRGKDGGKRVEVDVSGKLVQELGEEEPKPGYDFHLTIDHRIQMAAEKAVDDQLSSIGAGAAAAVVLNPKTGEILAMVSRPAFDPNLFVNGISEKDWKPINENPNHPMVNKAINGEYPPGSTFKIVTGVAALTNGNVTPEEKILDTGVFYIDEKTNAGGEVLGWLNFEEAMAHSDNYYFYEMGIRMGIDVLEKYARMFGLGKETGVNLPDESEGLVANRKYKMDTFEEEWYPGETCDAAIGQGFQAVTPLQAAMVMGEIAAGGKCYRPHLVKKITTADGQMIKEFSPELVSTLEVPDSVIRLVQQGLKGVTQYGTAAGVFAGFPVEIAGKTGTAENSQGADHGWFVAYGPFNNPDVVVAVIVEQGGFGSLSAVPIGRRILEAVFDIPGQLMVESKTNETEPAAPVPTEKKKTPVGPVPKKERLNRKTQTGIITP